MRHVLVVEDDPAVCDLIEMVLGDEGCYRTTHAYDGNLAIEALYLPDRPDLAIIDLLLPGLSGMEVARAAIDRNVPVLLMSAALEQTDRLAALDCPHLAKPFSLAELQDRLQHLMDNREEVLARTSVAIEAMLEKSVALAVPEVRADRRRARLDRDSPVEKETA